MIDLNIKVSMPVLEEMFVLSAAIEQGDKAGESAARDVLGPFLVDAVVAEIERRRG